MKRTMGIISCFLLFVGLVAFGFFVILQSNAVVQEIGAVYPNTASAIQGLLIIIGVIILIASMIGLIVILTNL